MKLLPIGILALSLVGCPLFMDGSPGAGGEAQKARQPAVAGSFYPADAKQLTAMIDGFLAKAAPPASGNPIAIVAPHAGYIYSGGVAAYSYALLKGRKYDRVVVIAPSHYEAFGFSSVYNGTAYRTPLGEVPVDQEFSARLAKMHRSIRLSAVGHTPSPDHPEHSIEVQLPFLQRVLGRFELVPIVMGDQSYDACRALGAALAKLAEGTNTLIVASSDLSHYHPYDEAGKLDHKLLRAVEEYDYFNLAHNLENRVWEACGGGPIVAAMIAAERLGATQAKVLRYANTGDVTGDRGQVVGYAAIALAEPAGSAGNAEPAFSLAPAEKSALLEIARKSVETAVRQHKPYQCSAGGMEALAQERGAFVTLTEKGRLRGCIGYVSPLKPLYQTVRDVAAFAALQDHRFRPVTAAELPELQYEISVLSPLHHVRNIEEIRIGVDGLLIYTGDHEGLLLPQVASEEHWDRATFLEQVCYKAGLPPRAWQDAGADLFRFTALVFGERRQEGAFLVPSRPAADSPRPTLALF